MHDTDLYARILGIAAPWHVSEVQLRLDEGEVVGELGGVVDNPAGVGMRGPDDRDAHAPHSPRERTMRSASSATAPMIRPVTNSSMVFVVRWK